MSLFDGLTNLFNPKNPAKAGMPEFDQASQMMPQYYQPYMQAGQQQIPQLQAQYQKLLSDPNGIVNQIGQGYHQSPGYQYRLNQGEQAITNANAAGGMLGTNQHQQQAGQLAENMAGDDYYKYMDSQLGQYNKSLGYALPGMEDMMHQGQTGSNDLATNLAQLLMSKGVLQTEAQRYDNEKNAGWLSRFGSALKGGASGAAAGSVAGPWGALAGGLAGGIGGLFGGSK